MFSTILLLLAASTSQVLAIVLPLVALPIGGVAGYFISDRLIKTKMGNAKSKAEKLIEDAANESKKLKEEANTEADKIKNNAKIEAKEEFFRLRNEAERENKISRSEIQRTEQRLIQKEETLNRKEDNLDKKIENVDNQKKNLENKLVELKKRESDLEESKEKIIQELERVAQFTKEEAKAQVIAAIEADAKREAAIIVRDLEAQARDEADKKAKEIIGISIQKCAADHVAEMTVSVVPLPNDDMKGRIIGREGRNIRALESATGIDLIIDDTPEAVVLSGFDPVRREVARIALEKLITDGRIHPARIEEVVEKTRKEVDVNIKETGEAAMFEAGIHQMHPELIKLLGRLKFRTSYGQNILKHSIEVSHLAGMMAAELGADVNLAKRGGLLHDIGKAVDHEVEGTHISIGVDLATKFKENKAVIHCIAAHHNDIEPKTMEAVLVQAADAISSARPGARRETLENYVKRLEKLEGIANSFEGVEKSFAIQAGREIRIMVKPEVIDDNQALFMAKDIARKIENEMEYPGQIKVNVIRESRSIDFAK